MSALLPFPTITSIDPADLRDAINQIARIRQQDIGTYSNFQNVGFSAAGFVPTAPNDVTKFLRGDATWAAPTSGSITVFSNSLISNVSMGVQNNFYDGPSVAQGTSGKFYASGTITASDSSAAAAFCAKLHDGTTLIASSVMQSQGIASPISIGLSGYLSNPAGNLRISVANLSSTHGSIQAANTIAGSSTLTVLQLP